MTSQTEGFAPYHRWDRRFFLLFLATCWLGVIAGFYPASSARLAGHADYPAPWFLHVHAAAFVGWMLLLTTQILLVTASHTAIHRRLGLIGLVLVPVMVASAITSEFYSQRFYLKLDPDNLSFFIIPLLYGLAFGVLATAALVYARRDPATHKRLILMATTVIVGAAYARWLGGSIKTVVGNDFWGLLANTYFGSNLILIVAMAYDFATRRRVHPAYLIGVPAIITMQFLATWAYHSDWWVKTARTLVEGNVLRLASP